MKNTVKLIGIVALGAVIFFGVIACASGTTPRGGSAPPENINTIRITGVTGNDLPAAGTYTLIRFRVFSGTHANATLAAGNTMSNFNNLTNNQVLQIPLYYPTQVTTGPINSIGVGGTASTNPAWTGHGEHFIMLQFANDQGAVAVFWYTGGAELNTSADLVRYNFTSDLSEIEFSNFRRQPGS